MKKINNLLAIMAAAILIPLISGCGGGGGGAAAVTAEAGRVAASVHLKGPASSRAAGQSASGSVRVDITITGVYAKDGTAFEPVTTSVDVDLATGRSMVKIVQVPVGNNHLVTAVADWGATTETVKAVIPVLPKNETSYVTVDTASTVAADTVEYFAQREGLDLPGVGADTVVLICDAVDEMADAGTAYTAMAPESVLAHMERMRTPARMIVSPASVSLSMNGQKQFFGIVYNGNDQVMTGQAVTFSVSPSSAGSVNSKGWFTPAAPGSAVVTAASGALTASANVIVDAECRTDAECTGGAICVNAGADSAVCAACGSATDCDDGDPDTTDACFAAGTSGAACGNIPSADIHISAGGRHACMINPDTTVQCWGSGAYGQLGNGANTVTAATPVAVSGLTGARSVSAGFFHTCALLDGGAVKCWGLNTYGQLGDGTTTSSNTPVSAISGAESISAGMEHSCAVLSGGAVKCWGHNNNGQLGAGTQADSPSPVSVSGLAAAVSVAAGRYHTCASLLDGSAWCWGINVQGQLGNGGNYSISVPDRVNAIISAISVSVGRNHSCALIAGGGVQCWGSNTGGELGDGTGGNTNVPVPYGNIADAVSVKPGYYHTCALLSGGTAVCSGSGPYGELGDGALHANPDHVLSPVAATAAGQGISEISAGPSFTCVLRSGGSRACFGDNSYGQLGNGAVN